MKDQIFSCSLFLRNRNEGLVARFQVFILIDMILGSPRSEKRKSLIVSNSKMGSKVDELRRNFRAGRSRAEQSTSIPYIRFFLTYSPCVIFVEVEP
jgi:hypothetical protein